MMMKCKTRDGWTYSGGLSVYDNYPLSCWWSWWFYYYYYYDNDVILLYYNYSSIITSVCDVYLLYFILSITIFAGCCFLLYIYIIIGCCCSRRKTFATSSPSPAFDLTNKIRPQALGPEAASDTWCCRDPHPLVTTTKMLPFSFFWDLGSSCRSQATLSTSFLRIWRDGRKPCK